MAATNKVVTNVDKGVGNKTLLYYCGDSEKWQSPYWKYKEDYSGKLEVKLLPESALITLSAKKKVSQYKRFLESYVDSELQQLRMWN